MAVRKEVVKRPPEYASRAAKNGQAQVEALVQALLEPLARRELLGLMSV
jgi:hypothetical protein